MNTLTLNFHRDNQDFTEERILIRAYHTSEALKDAIWESVANYSRMGSKSVNILREGPFIRVIFKQRESDG